MYFTISKQKSLYLIYLLLLLTSWLKRPKAVLITATMWLRHIWDMASQNKSSNFMFLSIFWWNLFVVGGKGVNILFLGKLFLFGETSFGKLYLVKLHLAKTLFGETSFCLDWIHKSFPWLCQVLHCVRQWKMCKCALIMAATKEP